MPHMPDHLSFSADMLKIHQNADAPRFTRIAQPELVKLANTRLQKDFLPIFTTNMELTSRKPYDDKLGLMDVYMPGRWDTTSNLIFMEAIVQGQSIGEWDGTAVYAHFTPTTSGQHLIAVHFTGFQTTMRLHGPWGTTTATTATTSDAGAVMALANAMAGQSIYFTVDCVVPNNLAGTGYIEAIEAFN
jgi:hypothetical protein